MSTPQAMTSRQIEASMKPRCPQAGKVEALYAARAAQVDDLSSRGIVTHQDLHDLDRLGRVEVASNHWSICTAEAQKALLNDAHPHVVSCASLSAAATKIQPALLSNASLDAALTRAQAHNPSTGYCQEVEAAFLLRAERNRRRADGAYSPGRLPVQLRHETLTLREVEATWPRLTWALCQAGLLSGTEASSALLQYFRADASTRATGAFGGEAVSHFGGIQPLFVAARRYRLAAITRQRAKGLDPFMSQVRPAA